MFQRVVRVEARDRDGSLKVEGARFNIYINNTPLPVLKEGGRVRHRSCR